MFERNQIVPFLKKAGQEALLCGLYGAGSAGALAMIGGIVEREAADTNSRRYEQLLPDQTSIIGPVELTESQTHALQMISEAEEHHDQGNELLAYGALLAAPALITESVRLLEKADRKYTLR